MELRGTINNIRVYDDFAHHPTAITSTLNGLRHRVGKERIIAVLEPRSNTMRMGIHKQELIPALNDADVIIFHQADELSWSLEDISKDIGEHSHVYTSIESIINYIAGEARSGDHILIMSNGGFGDIHQRLLDKLQTCTAA
jgi:UDP-N-acetylmuramate: L-alanyl-gamma-D-glutamyl-meso-diaminopimelate ligase